MDILCTIKVPIFVHLAVGQTLGTILLCYGIAVGYGHVPAWLPMISDCAVEAPEKYPFRLGIIIGAALLGVEVLLVFFADRKFSKNRFCLVVGILSSLGLEIVGAVNEVENNTIHSGGAIVFFFGYEAYMVVMTWYSFTEESVTLPSITVKKICTIVGATALIAFVILSTNWDKYQLYIAICEWSGTFAILVFQWTFAFDLTGIAICETKASNKVVYSEPIFEDKKINWLKKRLNKT